MQHLVGRDDVEGIEPVEEDDLRVHQEGSSHSLSVWLKLESAAMVAQPPPSSPAFLLIGLGRILRDEVETALRPDGLTLRHVSALGHLARQPGLSYSELGRRAGVTAQSMQATLRQLEDRGAVQRRTVPGRGRTAQLHVTAAGTDLLRRGRRAFSDADRRLLADVPADDREVLAALLHRAFAAAAAQRAAR